MEKNQFLAEHSYQSLIWQIVGEVRDQFHYYGPGFINSRNGRIKISIVPLSRIANQWLGGLSEYCVNRAGIEHVDVCEREFVFRLDPMLRNELSEAFSDSQLYVQQFFTEDNGRSMHDRAVYTTIMLDEEDFCRLCVRCTLCEELDEDKNCSLAGMLAAQGYFSCYSGLVNFNPCIDGKKFSLEHQVRRCY